MKKTITLLFLFTVFGVNVSDAQFSGLGKSLLKKAQEAVAKGVTNAVEKKVEEKVTEQADSILSRTLDNLGKAKKDSLMNAADADKAIKSADSIRAVLKAKPKAK